MAEAWEQLSLYESKDLISRFYQQYHGGSITAAKAKEINSHLTQGREFFASASQAAEVVRPLLLYYGVLSLSRGLILFLDPYAREATLSKSHGLDFHWQQDRDRVVTLNNVSKLVVKLEEGTFSELIQATENIERNTISSYGATNIKVDQVGTTDGALEATATLEEILAQVPDLQKLFERTFDRLSDCYPAEICYLGFSYDRHSTGVHILETDLGRLPAEEQIREAFKLPSDTNVYSKDTYNPWCEGASKEIRNFRLEVHSARETDLLQNMPIRTARNGNKFAVVPLSNRLRFSSLSLLFIVAYALSMLVRYYPSQWQAIINREAGDLAFPLLKAATSVVEQRFPALLLEELEVRTGR